jgi:hypothetical protein
MFRIVVAIFRIDLTIFRFDLGIFRIDVGIFRINVTIFRFDLSIFQKKIINHCQRKTCFSIAKGILFTNIVKLLNKKDVYSIQKIMLSAVGSQTRIVVIYK